MPIHKKQYDVMQYINNTQNVSVVRGGVEDKKTMSLFTYIKRNSFSGTNIGENEKPGN